MPETQPENQPENPRENQQEKPRRREIRAGDVAWRTHTFTAGEFETFAALSGDRNPVHHDPAFCAETGFGAPIVPLAMVLGPVSALIGMVLPGPGAVILHTEFRPVQAVMFDREVTYSLRVQTVSAGTGVLACRVLAVQGRTVVLEGEVQTTVRGPQPPAQAAAGGELLPVEEQRLALVTGAAGDIGSAVARELARAGWDLLLVHRGPGRRLDELVTHCRRLGVEVHTAAAADLTVPADRAAVGKLAGELAPTAVVHAAAPPLTAPHAEHLEVGYAALRDLAAAALPGMLVRQHGTLVLLGSAAARHHPAGWEDYLAAKAAAAGLLQGLDHRHGRHGIHAVVVEPGYVEGRYSREVRPAGHVGLMPEEVAAAVGEALAAPASVRVSVTPEGTWRSPLDGRPPAEAGTPARAGAAPGPADAPAAHSASHRDRVAAVVRRVLGLPPGADVGSGGVGVTPGWDSLRHIRIVLGVEAEFGVRLPSAALSGSGGFDALCRLVEQQVGP
jgi:NADP-dependent 3-hydroxy acid dehydrogenase YdfG/acyl dehydratase/acyl carrier protein